MDFLKAFLPPGSPGFLLAAIGLGLIVGYVWPRRRRPGLGIILVVLGGYLLLAWPPAVHGLIRTLPAPAPATAADAPPLDVLIVFDGDNRQGRARLAAAIDAAQAPQRFQVLGSSLILEELTPGLLRRYRYAQAANTREQMAWVRQFVETNPDARIGIIVSRLQAPRVLRLAARAGLRVPVLGAELDEEPTSSGLRGLAPSLAALAAGRDALYERLALWYYALRGWI